MKKMEPIKKIITSELVNKSGEMLTHELIISLSENIICSIYKFVKDTTSDEETND